MIFPGFNGQNSCWDAVFPGSYLSHFTHFWHLGLRFDPSFLFFFHGQCLSDMRFPWSTLSTAFMGGCLLPLFPLL